MSNESPEGFAKKGTTLEGRVAQLLRLMGFNVSRNEIIEGHEIDVYGEKEEEKIIVECKEYYTQLIPRDLILIFSTKVRDIKPTEAWFVTIYDFESSALELCKRYSIRAINGYDLEELEDQAIIQKGKVDIGSIPQEDRYLRLLYRRRTELSRERRRITEIRKIVDQINSLRKKRIELPPFLFPKTERDLEEKYIWLRELETMPKISHEGKVTDIIVNISSPPKIQGFRISQERKLSLAPILVLIFWIVSFLLLYFQQNWVFDFTHILGIWHFITPLQYFSPSIVLSIIVIYFRKKLIYKKIQIINRSISDAEIIRNVLYFPTVSTPFYEHHWDFPSQKLFGLNAKLLAKTSFGKTNNYVVDKRTWLISGVEVLLDPSMSNETGVEYVIIPSENLEFTISYNRIPEMKVNAIYVLSEDFFKERKLV